MPVKRCHICVTIWTTSCWIRLGPTGLSLIKAKPLLTSRRRISDCLPDLFRIGPGTRLRRLSSTGSPLNMEQITSLLLPRCVVAVAPGLQSQLSPLIIFGDMFTSASFKKHARWFFQGSIWGYCGICIKKNRTMPQCWCGWPRPFFVTSRNRKN